jgi:hypothetical protein
MFWSFEETAQFVKCEESVNKNNECGVAAKNVENFGIQRLTFKEAQFGGKWFWVK